MHFVLCSLKGSTKIHDFAPRKRNDQLPRAFPDTKHYIVRPLNITMMTLHIKRIFQFVVPNNSTSFYVLSVLQWHTYNMTTNALMLK